jgi:hypothetical protein
MLYNNSYVPHSNNNNNNNNNNNGTATASSIMKEETSSSSSSSPVLPSLIPLQQRQQQFLSIPSSVNSNKKMITVKASYKNVTRRFFLGYLDPQSYYPIHQENELPTMDLYQMLLEKIYTLFQFKQNYSITIQYLDDENDIIPIHSTDELTCAMYCQQRAAIRKQQELQKKDPSYFIPCAQMEQQSREQILRINIVHSTKKIYSKKRTIYSTPTSNKRSDKELKHHSTIDNRSKITTPKDIVAC